MKPDRETTKVLSEGEQLKLLTEHSGWRILREKYLKKVASLVNIMDIKTPDPNFIVQVVAARQESARILIEFLSELEGTVEQHKNNAQPFYQELKDEYIIHLKDLES